MKKNLDYYKSLPYSLHLNMVEEEDGDRYFIAEYIELRGCKEDGSTEAEAIFNLQDLFDEYITIFLKAEIPIPEPN